MIEENLKTVFKTFFTKLYNSIKKIQMTLRHNFLDLKTKMENGKFIVGFFKKGNNFPLSIIRMPYKSSIYLCIAKANNNVDTFYLSVKPLRSRMTKEGAQNDKPSNVSKKTFNRHQIYFYEDKA